MGRWPAQNRVGRAKRGNRTGPELQNRPANNQEQVFQGPDHRPAETFMTMTRPIAGTPICWFDRQTDRQTRQTGQTEPGAKLCDQGGLGIYGRAQPQDLGFELLPLRIGHTRVLPGCARRVVDFRAIRANSYPEETVPEWLPLTLGHPGGFECSSLDCDRSPDGSARPTYPWKSLPANSCHLVASWQSCSTPNIHLGDAPGRPTSASRRWLTLWQRAYSSLGQS